MELSDDGEYLLVSIYKVINEETLFYVKITEPRKEGFKKELVLTQLTTTPASYTVNKVISFVHIYSFSKLFMHVCI